MTDLERMAIEAGFGIEQQSGAFCGSAAQLERLSALIRADERETCAVIASKQWAIDGQFTADEFAAAIRAGSEPAGRSEG